MSDLERVSKLGRLMVRQQERVKEIEAELKEAKAALRQTAEEDLPDLMIEVGLSEIKLSNGETISLSENVTASIPKKSQFAAMRWLADNGFGGLIKTEVTVPFGRGEYDQATETAKSLADKFSDVNVKEIVHPATLKSFVTEQMQEGHAIPMDLLGVHVYNVAKLKKG